MSAPQTQVGYVFEGSSEKAFHIRFYAHENGVRKQRSAKLCNKDSEHPSKDSPAVVKLAADFILKINEANGLNDAVPGHNCPVCGKRCPRTIEGKFAKRV
jgi:hypothetical protein